MARGTDIVIIKCKWVKVPNKRSRVAEWIRKQNLYICCLRKTHFRSKYTHSEREGMQKVILCKWESKESWDINTYDRENSLWSKDSSKRQRGTLPNDQEINPREKI